MLLICWDNTSKLLIYLLSKRFITKSVSDIQQAIIQPSFLKEIIPRKNPNTSVTFSKALSSQNTGFLTVRKYIYWDFASLMKPNQCQLGEGNRKFIKKGRFKNRSRGLEKYFLVFSLKLIARALTSFDVLASA